MELGGLQRSATSYRRQGSSGLVWDDKLIAEFSRQADAERAERAAAEAAASAAGDGEGGDPSSGAPDALTDTTNLQVKTDAPPSEPAKMRRSHSAGGRAYRSVKVASSPIPNVDPPSPKVSTCCGIFATPKPPTDGRRRCGGRQQPPRKQMKKASNRT
ncbi:unnamed protein product [Linum trigynum]|uniref:Uncharacterized protein n=1 Tax=Linum trigynum TaxID=586398 RepID=A0AAV2CSS8_9ROSI